MKLRYKIATTLGVLVVAAASSLAVVLSYNSDCSPAPPFAGGAESIKAIFYSCYGSPDVLKLETMDKPAPAADGVLVKVKAASVNPLDWHYMRGEPYIMRLGSGLGKPEDTRLGVDFAGAGKLAAIGDKTERALVNAGFQVDQLQVRVPEPEFLQGDPPDVIIGNRAGNRAADMFGALHVMPGIFYVRFVKHGWNVVRQDLVDAAAGHHVAAQKESDLRGIGVLIRLFRERCHGH